MKKFLSIILAIFMLMSLVACSKAPDNKVDLDDSGKTEESVSAEWKQVYEKAIQEYIDADVYISSVYIADVDNDGIPVVSFSTNPYFYKTPNVILNFVDGKLAEIVDFETEDSGSSVKEAIYFVNGTNYVVYRSYGNSAGTFGVNEFQKIYSISKSGEYEVISEKEYKLTADTSKEYDKMMASGGTDIAKYQKEIVSQMDKDIESVTGSKANLIEYQTVARDYTVMSEPEFTITMKNAVDFINEKLDIELKTK